MPKTTKGEREKEYSPKTFHVTPCCKTRHWHAVLRHDIPENVYQCEFCDQMFDGELLEEVARGLNPLTFFCDKCHISAETELIRTQNDH